MDTRPHSDDSPAIYVGTYKKYNEGSIAGAWICLDGLDKESFYESCRALHADESDPEFMFQDSQNSPKGFICETHLADEIWDWIELDDSDREMLTRYWDAIGDGDIEDARDAFHGTAESEAEFAENLAYECADIPDDLPEWIKNAIDWERVWNYSLRYDYSTSTGDDGMIWFFHN